MGDIIKIKGILKASGDIDGGNAIKIGIKDNTYVLDKFRDVYLPAEGEDLRIAGTLIGKKVYIIIVEDENQENENELDEENYKENVKKREEWDLGHE